MSRYDDEGETDSEREKREEREREDESPDHILKVHTDISDRWRREEDYESRIRNGEIVEPTPSAPASKPSNSDSFDCFTAALMILLGLVLFGMLCFFAFYKM